MPPPQVWTQERCLRLMAEWLLEHDETMSGTQWMALPGHPSIGVVQRHFGTPRAFQRYVLATKAWMRQQIEKRAQDEQEQDLANRLLDAALLNHHLRLVHSWMSDSKAFEAVAALVLADCQRSHDGSS